MENNIGSYDLNNMIYEGKEPYIFISYAHKDSDRVIPIISFLQQNGFRVWYDAGIQAGTEWPEYIAEHLFYCDCVIAFISKFSVDSPNCSREINFAISKQKNVLAVYLEEVELSLGMQMQLDSLQALFKYRHLREDSFRKTLTQSQLLQNSLLSIDECSVAVNEIKPDTEQYNNTNENNTYYEQCDAVSTLVEDEENEKCDLNFENDTALSETEFSQTEPEEKRQIIDEGICSGSFSRVNWTLFDDGELLISGKGKIDDYFVCRAPWYIHNEDITDVVIEEGISYIGERAFYECDYIENVRISDSVTAIGEEAFCDCESLETIVWSDCLIEIGKSAFSGCRSLKEIILPCGLKRISRDVFDSCYGLEKIVLPTKVAFIGSGTFSYTKLKTLIALNPDLSLYAACVPKGTKIIAPSGSLAEKFSKKCGYDFQVISDDYKAYAVCSEALENDSVSCIEEGNCGKEAVYKFYDNGDLIISGKGDIEDLTAYFAQPWRNISCYVKRVVLEDGITGIGAFSFCFLENAVYFSIPDSVKTINEGGLSNLCSLSSINIPKNVTKIEYSIIDENIEKIIILNPELDISELEFSETTKIVAHKDSLSQKFAAENGYVFEAIS